MNENLHNSNDYTMRIDELVTCLNRASEAYYGGNDEILSNFEWDLMFDELSELEKLSGYIRDDSPTKNVSGNVDEESAGEKEEHEFPALSLAKTKKIDELKAWAMDKPIYLSYKLDGLTLVLTYDNGNLNKILTRGNGTIGTNITYLKDSISGFPLKIDYKGHLVVRGEATISYTDFDIINALIDDEDEKYANPRNLASGTLALDDPLKVKERHICFNAFTLVHIDEKMNSWGERMDFLKQLGFVTVDYVRCDANSLEARIDDYTKRVDDGLMDIPVDGLVICYEDCDFASSGTVTGHHALRAGYAFKWADVSAYTKLKYVEWSCAASTISPVAVFEPVLLEGTTVSRASLCNISEMERLNVTDNCTLEIIKANKIIPKCISVKDSVGVLAIPTRCPVCDKETVVRISEKSGTKTLHCTSSLCPAKKVKKFTRFVSKSGMDIDGLSIQTMLKFINMGYIADFYDIFHLANYGEEISKLEGFGLKSVENILNAIEKSRKVKAVNFIYALCIPLIGLDAGKKLIASLGFEGFIKRLKNQEDFEDIDGIGPEKSQQIMKWFLENDNASSLDKLLEEVTILDGEARNSDDGALNGLTFVITGDVGIFKNRDDFKLYVENNGGKVAGSVSKKTSFLVNNDLESASSKNKKAKELGIPIISEKEFVDMFGNT